MSVAMMLAAQQSCGETPAITDKAVDALVQPYLDAGIVNAVSIGIVQGSKSRSRHYGQLSSRSPEKPTDQTVYEIGSMSKAFTGILLAHAVAAGRVKLDQPIGSLMKELQEANKEVGDSILLQHLATHTSGLPRIPSNMNPAQPDPYADYDRKLLTEYMCQVRPKREPGVKEYSNLGAGLLGDLLAAEAGKTYEELLVKNIAQPLAMSDTRLTLSDDQVRRLAPPHNADRAPDRSWEFDALAGAGAIRSTPEDMLRFIQANLDPPPSPLGKAIELAWKQHIPAKGQAFAMGLGW
jgi:CubicO group peptidase (beta-lactamase class C family)